MKFTISSSKLFSQLQAVSRVINSKNALPILDDVLFDVSGNELKLTASDGETTIRTSVELESVEGAGKVASAAKLLLETLKEFSEQPLAFTIDENNFAVNMVSQNGTYSFVGVNGNEYPEMPAVEGDAQSVAVPANVLQNAIEKTIFCTADDDLRPVMNGIFFDIDPEVTTLVASDAHKLICYSFSGAKLSQKSSFILHKKPASILKSILARYDEDITIRYDNKNAYFSFGSNILVCRLIEGNYPAYRSVIPKNNNNHLVIGRADLLGVVKRIAVCSNQISNQIRLKLSLNELLISAQDLGFSMSAHETLPCQYDGQEMEIGFKAPFLLEILGNLPYQNICMQLADPARAALIVSADEAKPGVDIRALLMPVMINA